MSTAPHSVVWQLWLARDFNNIHNIDWPNLLIYHLALLISTVSNTC